MDANDSHLNLPKKIHGKWEWAVNYDLNENARMPVERILSYERVLTSESPVWHEEIDLREQSSMAESLFKRYGDMRFAFSDVLGLIITNEKSNTDIATFDEPWYGLNDKL